MSKILKDVTNNGVIVTLKELGMHKIKPGHKVLIEKIDSSKQYDIFLKLLGLWNLLLKESAMQTGYRSEYWAYEYKFRGGFGYIIPTPTGENKFIPKSMAWGKCTIEDRSKLFKGTFEYIEEFEIFDTNRFKLDYLKITGKELI